MSKSYSPNRPTGPEDPLAELIRAAGRRAEPPAAYYASVEEAARTAWQAKLRTRKRTRFTYAMAASIAIAACAVALVLVTGPRNQPQVATAQILRGEVLRLSAETGTWDPLADSGTSIDSGDRLRTSSNSGAAFELSTGTSLRLGEETEILITAADAMTLAFGTAYIDTGPNVQKMALSIETPFGTVHDIGTQFELRATAAALRLRVRSGSVEVMRPGESVEQAAARDELEIPTAGSVRRSEIRSDDAEWNWIHALAVAPRGASNTILSYLEWIAREMGRELRFDTINTQFRAGMETWNHDLSGLTPLEVLELIEQGSDFNYQLLDDGAILLSR